MNKQDIKKMGEAWSSVVNPVVEVLEEGTELFQVNIKGEGCQSFQEDAYR
jgi:hypothetical protein